jgi:translation initiation factor 4B
MAPKQKVKMSLNDFMNDEEFGSVGGGAWADEDMPIPPPSTFTDPTNQSWTANKRDLPPPQDRGMQRSFREPRDPVPIPDSPPYTARFGNLSFDVREEDLSSLLSEGYRVSKIRVTTDAGGRARGVAFVEFEDRASLEAALKLNDQDFLGRQLRIMVAERSNADVQDEKFNNDWRSANRGPLRDNVGGARREEPEDNRDYDNWSRRGPLPPLEGDRAPRRGGFGAGGRAPRRDPTDDVDNWRRGDSKPRPTGRPKIELAPRTVGSRDATAPPPPAATSKSSIFGGAKPVDTQKKLLEVEERQRQFEKEKFGSKKPQQQQQQEKSQNEETEQVRKRFDVLATGDEDEEEEEKTKPSGKPAAEKQETADPVRPVEREAGKTEMEDQDWEVVQRKK